MKNNNIISFPLNKEDIMRLKPEDICGRVWKVSRYGNAVDNNNDGLKTTTALKVVQQQQQQPPPPKISKSDNTRKLENISPLNILEKFDDYIEDTAEKLWNILKKGVFNEKKKKT